MRLIILWALLAAHLFAIALFCLGFFPSKTLLQGFSDFYNDQYDQQFDKVVVMVIDALRSDFMFSEDSSMDFVHSLINKGSAIGFTAYSNPPTVTLPRLKGITTGSTPSFLDAVLNVIEGDESSSLGSQDTWITQLKLQDKKIRMFGDETWLKLFPDVFDEFEGTSSFFVSDFEEVDNNVTRHLDRQLAQQDFWDGLVLHYLGLDHIGHKGGPTSVFMKPKQKEMDSIIRKIYNSLNKDTLFVVLGDHGMNDIGNHGGSSKGETSAALLFVSDKFQKLDLQQKAPLEYNEDFTYYQRVQQIDLVPTVSNLLHLPIPKNSLGIIIRSFLDLWNASDRANVLLENLSHLNSLIKNGNGPKDAFTEDETFEYLNDIQSDLTRSSTNYNIPVIKSGITILFVVTILSTILAVLEFGKHSIFLIFGSLAFGITSFGSSLVEEEHQIWWWFSTFIIGSFFLSSFFIEGFGSFDKFTLFITLLSIRIIRGWNSNGQKYVGDTISNYLIENNNLKWIILLLTISIYGFSLSHGSFGSVHTLLSFSVSFLLSIILITFKLFASVSNGDAIPPQFYGFVDYSMDSLGVETAQEGLVPMARMFFLVAIVSFLLRVGLRIYGVRTWYFSDILDILSFVLIFQTSIENAGIFLVLFIIKAQINASLRTSNVLCKLNKLDKVGYITLGSIILQHLSFFSFGQTNSLATIDLSNSYNGVKSYNIFATGLLTFLTNFSGPIFWSFASLTQIFETQDNLKIVKYQALQTRWITNLLFFTVSTLFILTSCYVQRYHLFIWTVFSPKILYSVAWNLFVNFAVELVILGIVVLY